MRKDQRGCLFCKLMCGVLDEFFDGWGNDGYLLARATITVSLRANLSMVVSALSLTEKAGLFYNYSYNEKYRDEGEHWSG
jgi:hypothetical protein